MRPLCLLGSADQREAQSAGVGICIPGMSPIEHSRGAAFTGETIAPSTVATMDVRYPPGIKTVATASMPTQPTSRRRKRPVAFVRGSIGLAGENAPYALEGICQRHNFVTSATTRSDPSAARAGKPRLNRRSTRFEPLPHQSHSGRRELSPGTSLIEVTPNR